MVLLFFIYVKNDLLQNEDTEIKNSFNYGKCKLMLKKYLDMKAFLFIVYTNSLSDIFLIGPIQTS